jgi:hypothetical protein
MESFTLSNNMAADDLSGGTLNEFKPADQFVPHEDVQPSITQHDPETYAGLTAGNALKEIWKLGLPVNGDQIIAIHNTALERAQNFQADTAKEQERKTLELQARAKAAERGPKGEASLLETERAEEAAVALRKEQAQKQYEQGALASAESASLAPKPGEPGPFIAKLPDEQRVRLEKLGTAYKAINDMQVLHAKTATSTAGAGGNIKSLLGDVIQTAHTSGYARALEAYTDANLTPIAVGVLGDKAAGATKENIQQQLRGTIPDRSDTIESAGNKIFLMKRNIMNQLQEMKKNNLGTYSTGEIGNLYMDLDKDYESDATQQWNLLNPQNDKPTVQVGNSAEGRQQVANALYAGTGQVAPTATPGPTPAPTPGPTPGPTPAPTPAPPGSPIQQLQATTAQIYRPQPGFPSIPQQ